MLAELPEIFAAEIREPHRSISEATAKVTADFEDDWSIGRSIELLKGTTIERGARHDTFVILVHRMFDLGVTPTTALALIEEHCPDAIGHDEPPEDQIDSVVEGRERDGKAWGRQHISVVNVYTTFLPVALTERNRPRGEAGGAAALTPKPVVNPSLERIPKRQWIVNDYILRGVVTALIAPGGVGKTQWTASLAIAVITTRRDILDLPIRERTKVWIWNQEDEENELKRRTVAVLQHFKIADADLIDENGSPMLFVNSGVERPFMLAKQNAMGFSATPDVDRMIAHIREREIGLLILDPVAELHNGPENDNAQMLIVWAAARTIAFKTNCAVLVAVHTRKHDKASPDGHIGDFESIRGASSQGGVIRAAFTLFNMGDKDAKAFGIPEDQRRYYVRLDNAKGNRSFEPGGPRWLRRTSVDIEARFADADGPEFVGVLAPVDLSPRVKVEKRTLAALLFDTMKTHFAPGEKKKTNSIVEKMAPQDQAAFGDGSNRAKSIKTMVRDAGQQFKLRKARLPTEGGSLIIHEGVGRSGFEMEWASS